ncbi:hypothetical protein niasHT_007925 [Heterodera trifolii]|uniref:Calpain catalytic domain-containing protein n=1 Tax=Heterodera trifolii TaxID=157864 RepID=A0ABD2LZG4_9BILA
MSDNSEEEPNYDGGGEEEEEDEQREEEEEEHDLNDEEEEQEEVEEEEGHEEEEEEKEEEEGEEEEEAEHEEEEEEREEEGKEEEEEQRYSDADWQGEDRRGEEEQQTEEQHESMERTEGQRETEKREKRGIAEFGGGETAKGILDGFGTGTMHDIIGQIGKISGKEGDGGGGGALLSNALAGGAFASFASNLFASAAHHFLGINPETGRIIGAIAGNLIFGLGGKHNSLSELGKLVLDNLISGKFQRKVSPFVSPRPDLPSFQLDFHSERDRCLRERRLFEDPEFPATDRSIFFSKSPPEGLQWKRPGELTSDPQLIASSSGASRFDVVQGQLGDCWLLAAAAVLTLREELFFRVVPPDQSFTENYAGIFHFQFWRYGQWVDVVIDDRLPTKDGHLLFMNSAKHHSFWSALLEKAYAKLYGSYEALKGGSTSEALEDFTGGLIEHFELAEMSREQLLAVLVRGFQMGSFFGCSIDADPSKMEAKLDNGLVMGHAYSITAIQSLHDDVVLLRVRNPWGQHEWNGRWSDGAPEWDQLTETQRHALCVEFGEDGEFWMSLDDFHKEFQRMECCNLGPEVLDEICSMMDLHTSDVPSRLRSSAQWAQFSSDGEWSRQKGTAGGCRNFPTFANNPQFGTTISFSISPNNGTEDDGKCTVICAVLQKYRRELRAVGLDELAIGFAVYATDEGTEEGQKHQQQKHTAQVSHVQRQNAEAPASGRSLGFGPGYGQPNSYGSAYVQQQHHVQQHQQQQQLQPLVQSHHTSYYQSLPQMQCQNRNILYGQTYETHLPKQQNCQYQTNPKRIGQQFLEGAKSVAKSASFINLREVTARFRLAPGQYVVVPSTFKPDEEGHFLLRLFCSGQLKANELN